MSLSLASVSTKMAGLAWLLMVLAGGFAVWQQRTVLPHQAFAAARIWLWICILALLVRSVPVAYWGDPWAERHAELRLLLGALGVWGLTRLKALPTAWALHGLAVAGLLGFFMVLMVGRDGFPTNAIPWAGGVAMMALVLLHGSVLLAAPVVQRGLWGLGAVAAMAAVLMSETRGAYGVVGWAAVWLLWQSRGKLTLKTLGAAALVSVLALVALRNTPLVQAPMNRVMLAVAEFQGSQARVEGAQNSSVGARVELWKLAAQAVPQKPWLGHGHDERLNLIHQWGKDHNSETVTNLGHMHNQYLHDLMDHGLVGLASTLIYLFGLTGMAIWLLKRKQAFAGWALGGVAFMHATTSLTNVNFAHNYYPTIMSLVVGVALVSMATESAPKQ